MPLSAGLTPDLWRVAGCVFLLGLWLSSRDLPLLAAIPVTAIKVAIPLVYFALEPAGILQVSDGLDYHHDAMALYRQGVGPLTLFHDPLAFLQFREAAGGLHVAYPFWNLVALSGFGPHYYAPVFLNVGLTFVAGWLFARLVRAAGAGVAYRRLALAFFLLHWDVVVWSSFLNLKDLWVMTLSLAALCLALSVFSSPGSPVSAARGVSSRRGLAWKVPLLVAVLGVLAAFRFYAPLLLLAALLAWRLVEGGARGRFAGAALCAAAFVALAAWRWDIFAQGAGRLDVPGMPFGALRFLATPLPWKLSPEYAFLFVPSLLHVLLLVPALLAVPWLWRASPAARLALLYLAVVILFYAAVPALQGPRQRLQAGFAFVWLQFHALWTLGRYAAGDLRSPGGDSSSVPAPMAGRAARPRA